MKRELRVLRFLLIRFLGAAAFGAGYFALAATVAPESSTELRPSPRRSLSRPQNDHLAALLAKPEWRGARSVTAKSDGSIAGALICPDLDSIRLALSSDQAVNGCAVATSGQSMWLRRATALPVVAPTSMERS